MTTQIKNIEHVDNLNTIAKLEKLGFEGSDACIETSLFEYGLIWKELPNGSFLFIYGIKTGDDSDWIKFDRCTFEANEMTLDNFDWADPTDETREALESIKSTPQFICDMFNLWGYENIFGSTYWEGFTVLPLVCEYDEGSLEAIVTNELREYFGRRITVIAHSLQHDGESWSTNDSWKMSDTNDFADIINDIDGRWDVFVANYADDATPNDLEFEGDDSVIYVNCSCIPFLEIRIGS